jgi:hypothetical protein
MLRTDRGNSGRACRKSPLKVEALEDRALLALYAVQVDGSVTTSYTASSGDQSFTWSAQNNGKFVDAGQLDEAEYHVIYDSWGDPDRVGVGIAEYVGDANYHSTGNDLRVTLLPDPSLGLKDGDTVKLYVQVEITVVGPDAHPGLSMSETFGIPQASLETQFSDVGGSHVGQSSGTDLWHLYWNMPHPLSNRTVDKTLSFVAHIGDSFPLTYNLVADGNLDTRNSPIVSTIEFHLTKPQPDLVATPPTWSTTQGGVDFGYTISGADLPQATTAAMYWAPDTTFDPLQDTLISGSVTTTQTAVGTYGPIHVDAATLGTPPSGTRYLLAVVDPDNTVTESDETNNVQSLPLEPDLTATSLTWDTAQGGVDFGYELSGAALPKDTTAALYWASGTTEDTILEPAATPIPIPKTTPVGQVQNVHVEAQDFTGGPAPGAKYLLLIVNPSGPHHAQESDEANDTNNLISMGMPLEIEPFQQSTYSLTADPNPAMPAITANARLVNLDSDPTATTTFHWQAKIEFDASTARHGPNKPIDYSYPVQEVTGTGEYKPDFQNDQGTQVIRGGDLTFELKAEIAGIVFDVKSDKLSILGENPSDENSVRAYVAQQAEAHGVGSYADDLGRIARQEGGGIYRQFLDDLPYFSEDNKGGAGMYQLTDPKPSAGQTWNWQLNVAEGVAIFATKVIAARNYPAQVQGSAGFVSLVKQLNQQRIAHRLPPLVVTVPAFTAYELRLDAIRGYNGFKGTDLGLHLHEWRVARDSKGRLQVQIIPGTNRAVAIWQRVPWTERPDPQDVKVANYVNLVLAQSP